MDLKLTSEIAITVGTVISTLTLLSAYRLYWIGKRDNYIKELRNILISYQYNSRCLNNLMTYDITHELIQTVVYSKQVKKFLKYVFDEFFTSSKEVNELEEYLENMNPITLSIHTQLLTEFNDLLKMNSQEASKVYTDYPSLYRVYEAVNYIFNQTIEISKHMVRDEDIFQDLLLNAFDEKENITSADLLVESIFYSLMSIIQQKQTENDQEDINDVLSLLTIATNGLMRLSDKELFKHKGKESKVSYKEFDVTKSIFEDLLEAEKGLKQILRDDELLEFREYSTKIKVRNEKTLPNNGS